MKLEELKITYEFVDELNGWICEYLKEGNKWYVNVIRNGKLYQMKKTVRNVTIDGAKALIEVLEVTLSDKNLKDKMR